MTCRRCGRDVTPGAPETMPDGSTKHVYRCRCGHAWILAMFGLAVSSP